MLATVIDVLPDCATGTIDTRLVAMFGSWLPTNARPLSVRRSVAAFGTTPEFGAALWADRNPLGIGWIVMHDPHSPHPEQSEQLPQLPHEPQEPQEPQLPAQPETQPPMQPPSPPRAPAIASATNCSPQPAKPAPKIAV